MMKNDWNEIKRFSKGRVQQQIIEHANIVGLEHNNLQCQNFKDVRDMWASEQGLTNHERVWQVQLV